jgi:hypothetical protein
VTVAATVINISGGSLSNATFGVPPADEQKADWNLVADSINRAGGAGCRQINLKIYTVNPVDASGAQRTCLDIAASRPYLVLDPGVLSEIGASDCIPAHKIPLASTYLTKSQLQKYSPYYLQIGDLPENITYNGTLGLNQLGYFSAAKGFKKVGVIYHTCNKDLLTAQRDAFKAAGLNDSQVDTYSLGCPTGSLDSPSAMEQAVLNFKQHGVTHVMMLEIVDGGIFTQIAQQQQFKPQYLFAENDVATNVKSGASAPNPVNFDGAVDAIGGAYGEQTTPGYQPSGGTQKCNSIYAAAGKPSVYSQTSGYPGVICDYLWFLQSLLNHAPSVQQNSLAHGMNAMGTIDFSYPFAPTDFSAAPPAAAYGVSYWRAVYYHASCSCWQVPDPTFNKPFTHA